jgi:pyridoxal phosphate enzyme (YggS family)
MTVMTENIQRIQEAIAAACARSHRSPSEVTLVAVSKTHPAEAVLEAAECGLRHFGENRVEESAEKIPAANARAPERLIWHMIGHIQSRKAKDVPPLFDVVHSVDSFKLASRLAQGAEAQGKKLDALLEINISGEESKSGLAAFRWSQDAAVQERLWDEIRQISTLPGLNLRGLMTMAPIVPEMEQARPVFAGLAELRSALAESLKLALPDLSMGMTDDYPVAVEEGATLVRVGRAIFGERHYTQVKGQAQ